MEIHVSNSELKCPVCAHKFVSIKSLYGHMRNHPDRNWRGMKPPIPGMRNNSFSSLPVSGLEMNHSGLESDGETHSGPDLILPGWSKTSRRTRPGKGLKIIPASDRALLVADNEKAEKALIINPASNRALSMSDNEGYDFPVLENGEPGKENLPLKKRKLESAVSPNTGNSRCSLPNRPLIIHGIPNPGPRSSKKEMDLIVNDNIACKNTVRARKPHVCDICDKSFKSYQALGGHKSHHNNKAHEIMSTREENEISTLFVDSYSERPEGRIVHKCPFCDKMFAKGQALGGHKRHCRRLVNGTMCSGRVQETRNQPRGIGFDLNELPPECISEHVSDL
ncbi:hypothetical protein DH2020_027965 [Rehmannia glutinosa]|uniref:C2H2-type domain-containing protein n=1 Tax=Rehmannia glutinosa TaxID=99300 RepID=A0ABR0VW89_REHGL